MDERDLLAQQFEANRSHLLAVACRMLGSRSEAEDAVQEAWLRLSRADTSEVENLGGWRRGPRPRSAAFGLVWAPGGRPRVVFGLTVASGKVVAIDLVMEPERVRQFDLAMLDA